MNGDDVELIIMLLKMLCLVIAFGIAMSFLDEFLGGD